ncbi:PTS sugar transporter subunit IIA [Brevibacillus daliensis]|uniref:PTS sugar transporter subunit IIA n=1 Tax=Brevibacillus daliensis TaxID=2892995 RepID=UPI001E5D5C88|nr:PTS sugar transporter subunit IIA [Brevibacillus daliensis]
MELKEVVHESIVKIFPESINQEEVLRHLSNLLLEEDYVKESFSRGVLKREREFPTGLELERIHVAIPHTEVEHVKEAAIAVGIVKQGTTFANMQNPLKSVKVHVVFMLALEKSESHMEILGKLMDMIQDDKILEKLIESNTASEVIQVIRNT